MKKKILVVMVCAALILTTACSDRTANSESIGRRSDKSSSVRSDNPAKPSEGGGSSAESDSSEAPLEGESSTPADSESSSSTPESSTPEEDSKFVHGTMDGNIYTSEFLGLKAELADGWTFMTEDILAQYNGVDYMSDENVNKALDTIAIVFDMYAETDAGASVNIVIENLNLTNGGKAISAESYIDEAIQGHEVEKTTTSFLGSEVPCIRRKISILGQNIVQCTIPLSRGMYMGIITFSGEDEDKVYSAMSMFSGI